MTDSTLDTLHDLNFDSFTGIAVDTLIDRWLSTLRLQEEPAPEDIHTWAARMLNLLRFSVKLEKGCSIVKAYILYLFERNWYQLPKDFREIYDYQFAIFATQETGGLSIDTIDNYKRAARVFIASGWSPFGHIKVPKRDRDGKILIDEKTGSQIVEEVKWDPTRVDITKLVYVTPLASAGKLAESPRLLSMVMDPGVTAGELRNAIYTRPDDNGDDYNLRFGVEGIFLVARRAGQSAVIATIAFDEYEDDPLVTEGIKRLFAMAGVKMDEEVIVNMDRERRERETNAHHSD